MCARCSTRSSLPMPLASVPAVPAAAAAGAAVADDKYAIIDVGGLRQFVEEGRWFAVKRDELQVCAVLCITARRLSGALMHVNA